jgi:uncharacterized protein
MPSDLIKKTTDYVRLKLYNEHTGHDWYHVERVLNIARKLQETEGGDLEDIELSVLLHDLGDYKKYNFNEKKGNLALGAMMDVLDIEEEKQKKIVKIIYEAEYKGDATKPPSTIEGKILQDADNLDALGAIGIARTFATGGFLKRMMHDPKRKVRHKLNKEDFQLRKQEGTSLNYFYEKILKLPSMMNTKKAKIIAEKRAKFIKLFIEEFLLECKGEE